MPNQQRKPLSDFQSWELSDLQAFLKEIEPFERKQFEFKGSDRFRESHLTEDDKFWLGKQVSAFANTQGGDLFLGVEEKDNTFFVGEGISQDKYDYPRIVDILTSCTNPNYLDLDVKPIQVRENQFVFIVHIPEFKVTPIQNRDMKYYRRSEGKSVPIPEDLIRALYFKAKYPNLDLQLDHEVTDRARERDGLIKTCKIKGILKNNSHIRAHDIKILFKMPSLGRSQPMLLQGKRVSRQPSFQADIIIKYPNHEYMEPLFGSEERTFYLTDDGHSRSYIEYDFKYQMITPDDHDRDTYSLTNRNDKIQWVLYADDAPPKNGGILLGQLIGEEVTWEDSQNYH
jgi:hypothetical protein